MILEDRSSVCISSFHLQNSFNPARLRMRYIFVPVSIQPLGNNNNTTKSVIQRYEPKELYLYLSPCSFLPCGSKPFLMPSRVLDTASLAPIIGFNTAIGTALTTAFNAPCLSVFWPCRKRDLDLHHHLISHRLPWEQPR